MTAPLAVLDVGSNTVRLLVARVDGESVQPILDRSEFVRLGKDVDATGALREDRMSAAVEAVSSLAALAEQSGASTLVATATSAVRDARNGEAFAERVREATGVPLQIISGEREAELTFRGASLGIALDGGVIICDLGGGSAELINASSEGIRWSGSYPLGSGRLTERFIRDDPPRPEQLDALRRGVETLLRSLPLVQAHAAVFTGGTASHLAYLAGRDGELECLALPAVADVLKLVSTQPAARIASERGVRLERAQVLPAGIATIDTIARFYGVQAVYITRHGLREGVLLDLAHSR